MFIRKIQTSFSHFVCLHDAFKGWAAPSLIMCSCLFSYEFQKNSTTEQNILFAIIEKNKGLSKILNYNEGLL